jgi:hypothetical protein
LSHDVSNFISFHELYFSRKDPTDKNETEMDTMQQLFDSFLELLLSDHFTSVLLTTFLPAVFKNLLDLDFATKVL